ncbi:TolC family protein [Chitinophagaceae bacterium LB-8]|uniref:TolC family protein n=1 Tax=Paraflavisolibacter caeni TaxID=2982496 RepID=A0A9X2XNM1_9BACT|nr:TolC family protein [Paraflavisolibacter caeni]MCU7548579.1 TolC family protein [Paraflavisolibacter caeni]
MKIVLTITTFFLLFSMASRAQSSSYTLEQCIETAIRNNIEVKQRELQTQSAEIDYKQSKTNLFPTLNGVINHGINQGRSIDPFTNSYVNQKVNYASYGLGSSVVLFNGLSQQKSIRQYQYASDASKMELQQVKDNLSLDVILAYLLVLSNEDLVELSKKQVEVSNKQVERLEILHKEGAINPSQLYDLKAQLKDDELTAVNNQNALAIAKLNLAQLMQLPFDSAMKVERIGMEELVQKYGPSLADVYNNAVNELALVKAARLRTESSAAAVRAIKGTFYPTLLLNGNLNTNYSSAASRDVLLNSTEVSSSNYVIVNGDKVPVVTKVNNYSSERIDYNSQLRNNVFSNIELSLRVPLFNSFQTRNRVKLANLELKYVTLTEENTKIQLRQEVERSYLNMNNAWERYKISQEQVAAYTESFRAADVRFNAGVGTSVDYLVAKNNLDRANMNLVMAKYGYLLRKRILDFYYGSGYRVK